ncbi:MAG: OsmC family protein [Firmicutes bacterium]|nr:OsmC family protein [Alicyclobacillaceae bacterium]MCL6498032.1 OsmC family protein [Bacillota bacterium]
MAVEVEFLGPMAFKGVSPTGHEVRMDAAPEVGGQDTGARPTEVLLMALAGCTGIDVVSILQKMRVTIARFGMTVDGDRAADHPKVFQTIRLTYRIQSPDATPEQVKRAVRLSQERYCSISAMLERAARMDVAVWLNGEELEHFSRGPVAVGS